MDTHTEKQDDTQLTRLQALKNEIGAMTPAQRDFISGKLSQADLRHEQEPVTKLELREQEFELREQERRLNSIETRVEDIAFKAVNAKYKAEAQGLDLSSQARSIDALAARVRRLESDAPIKEILVVGLAGVLFVSLIVSVANAVAEPV